MKDKCCCCFKIEFVEVDEMTLRFCEDPGDMEFDFGEVIFVDHDYDPYLGPYEVIPKAWEDQILATRGKNMTGDVKVFEVPYDEVSNPDGTTVIIAS